MSNPETLCAIFHPYLEIRRKCNPRSMTLLLFEKHLAMVNHGDYLISCFHYFFDNGNNIMSMTLIPVVYLCICKCIECKNCINYNIDSDLF